MMSSVPLTITNPQLPEISDLSDPPSSPESEPFDTADLLSSAVSDDVTTQLAAAGPIGVAAAAAVLSCRKRKHPHRFETNPSRRKRQQTRLLRKLKHTIEEYTTRVGQQAVVLCCTPGKNPSVQMYKVFGSQPLETVLRSNKQHVLSELETALLDQTPPAQQENPNLHELPHLVVDGIPTPVDKMTQAQLRNFIPEMLKYSTGRSKPGWGKIEYRPIWWPSDLPWANVRSDARTDEEKKKVPWTEALRLIVKNCYKHHGREDLLQVFNEDFNNTVQVQQQGYSGTMMQTINNPDGTLSIIQIDSGPNSIVTLPDGTQATVVHAIQDPSQQQPALQTSIEQAASLPADTIGLVPGPHQQVINSLQASLNQAGHIILAGGDTAQLNSIMTMVPVSMFQPVGVQPPSGTTLHTIPGLSFTQTLQPNIQIAMAPVLNNVLEGVVSDQCSTDSQEQQDSVPDAKHSVEAVLPKPNESLEEIVQT